jgi:hypothetical protein
MYELRSQMDWRKLHKKDLRDLCSSANSVTLLWNGHVKWRKDACRITKCCWVSLKK